MSKPRYRWWGYVKNVIRAYPELKQQYEDTGQASGGAHTPDAIRALSRQDQREYEAVSAAVWVTERYPNGKQRMDIIRMVYWKQSHTLDGAGEAAGYKEAQVRRINGAFIMLVAEYLGLL